MDRMEIIRLAGYSHQEKLEIANRYLWPRRLKEAGLQDKPLTLEEDVIPHIIKRYTREAGVPMSVPCQAVSSKPFAEPGPKIPS